MFYEEKKMRMHCFMLVISLFCFINFDLRAELLIFKKDATTGYLTPLAPEESILHGPSICQILLQYQWPMCLASDLTPDEKNELLTIGKPYAEELFIEKKLKEAIPAIDLHVAFIPTSLYELFEIIEFFIARKSSPISSIFTRTRTYPNRTIAKLNSFMNAAMYLDNTIKSKPSSLDNDILRLLNMPVTEHSKPAQIRKKVFDIYSTMNHIFYQSTLSKDSEIPVLRFNSDMIHFLSQQIPDFLQLSTSTDMTQKIFDNVTPILQEMINQFTRVYERRCLHDSHRHNALLNPTIILQAVALEYEAQRLNKALLFRGSKLITSPLGQGKIGEVISHTFHTPKESDNSLNAILANYQDNSSPFSISFGSSLFAGYINNQGGCAYSYLTTKDMSRQNFTGFALFINKKDQYEHDSSRLFFIPPLAPITALFQYGYLFHPRATAAVRSKDSPIKQIIGASGVLFQDPAGILIITRDPLKHASLFSEFVAKNSTLIEISQTPDAKDRSSKILQNQDQSTKFYKALNTVKKHTDSKRIMIANPTDIFH